MVRSSGNIAMTDPIQVFFFLDLLITVLCLFWLQKKLKPEDVFWSLFMNLIQMFGQMNLNLKSGKMNCTICKTGTMQEGTVTLEKNGSSSLSKWFLH